MPRPAIYILGLALALTGCQRLGLSNDISFLPASPTKPVQSQSLEPVDLVPADQQQAETQPGEQTNPNADPNADTPTETPEDGTQVAAAEPVTPSEPANSKTVGRTDLLGGWAVASAGDKCQLFMTLTTWTGGYRATTRRCSSETLKSISAWDLNGKQVILKNKEGVNVATLYATGAEQFNGQTTTGSGITVSR